MYLGLDCGTSGLKALLIDAGGEPVASAARSYSPDRPQRRLVGAESRRLGECDGRRDRGPQDSAGKALGAVKAIGFSGQMHGAVLLDRADKPMRPAILHNDGRAFLDADELARDHPDLARVVGVKPMPGFTGPKLKWIARHEPETASSSTSLLSPKDYLRLKLSGERASDMSDAAGTWLLDEARRDWSPEAFAACDADPRMGAALVRRIGAGRPDPARGRGRAGPAARRPARGRRRRRSGRRGGLGRHRARRSVHLARNRDATHRRDRQIYERAGEARARFRPCAAKPLVRDGGDAQRRRRPRFRRAASRRIPGRARA